MYLINKNVKFFAIFLMLGLVSCASSSMLKRTGYYDCGDFKCYYLNGIFYQLDNKIQNADLPTFKILMNAEPGYAVDKEKIYMGSKIIMGASPAGVIVLSDKHIKNSEKVYYEGAEIIGADPQSFEIIKKHSIFDTEQWGRDKKNAYFRGKKVDLCDAESFTPLGNQWAKDNKCVYGNYNDILHALDPKTFQPLNTMCVKDKNGFWIYYLKELSVASRMIALTQNGIRCSWPERSCGS
jgi:hypothetical protein